MTLQNKDGLSLDTVCRLYEVGRQKLAEEGDDEVRLDEMSLFRPGIKM